MTSVASAGERIYLGIDVSRDGCRRVGGPAGTRDRSAAAVMTAASRAGAIAHSSQVVARASAPIRPEGTAYTQS
jgi:hypothetical protein